jgi:aminopeptidase N
MRDAQPKTIRLADYRPPDFTVEQVALHFELFDECTLVHATLIFQRSEGAAADAALVLDGEELELLSIALDDRALADSDHRLEDGRLILPAAPRRGRLQTTVRLRPQFNTALEGLYRSRGLFCTQCEAEGFRKITWFPDRPDVMARYRVTIDADRDSCPELLSNGNCVAREELPDGRHRAVWEDPFPKSSYLFALVAGRLSRYEDCFRTAGGREVQLVLLVEEKDLGKCAHAMASLKRAMRWDEERFGLEYDLDVFHVVAVDDFNMGAMENKSLNIFNSSCVLASPDTTTDAGYQRIESIVGHEYFHNWSGNRVTCRDWFQLSLKEGFTVFRDAEFSADMGSRDLKRVEDVRVLRTLQFAEDAGPMAHPVRPASFIEISNFYTLTVYEKGAEVVRMLHTILGDEAFRAGADLYFERHDGQAVTCDDFLAAMEAASGRDLEQFSLWYSQAGTPEVTVTDTYDADSGRYRLSLRQHTPPTPGQSDKQALLIPVALGLLGEAGNLRLQLEGETVGGESADNTHRVLLLDETEKHFEFVGLPERPVPALLRGFSAPVRLHYDYDRSDLLALARRDDDGFVRWDAMQQLMVAVLDDLQTGAAIDPRLLQVVRDIAAQDNVDPAIRAEMLQLPSESYLAELAGHRGPVDVLAIHQSREQLRRAIAADSPQQWLSVYEALRVREAYAPSGEQVARRALAGVMLELLVTSGRSDLGESHYREADNLTDRLLALRALQREAPVAQVDALLEDFYARFGSETLAVNQWLQLQAGNPRGDALARVRRLMEHPAYDGNNPNKIRAVVGTFAKGNPVGFHRQDGAAYRFLGEVIEGLNARNPQIAASLLTPLTRWRNHGEGGLLMRGELERLAALPKLSTDVYEVVAKSLKSTGS